jgi:hypothetical protein
MSTQPDRHKVAREAGEKYGTMAADLSLVHISMAASEEAVQDHINNLVRNIREQAAQQARADLAAIWKEAALKAAQARLEAFGGPEDATIV